VFENDGGTAGGAALSLSRLLLLLEEVLLSREVDVFAWIDDKMLSSNKRVGSSASFDIDSFVCCSDNAFLVTSKRHTVSRKRFVLLAHAWFDTS
jgi:hypothetical protein